MWTISVDRKPRQSNKSEFQLSFGDPALQETLSRQLPYNIYDVSYIL